MKIKFLVGGLVFLIIINLATIGTYIYLQLNKSDHKFKYRPQDSLMIPPFLYQDDNGKNFSKEQREKFFGMFKNFRDETKDINEEIKVLQEEIKDQLMSEEVNEDDLDQKLQKVSALRLNISRIALKNIIQAKSFLTPEQVEHFVQAIMQFSPPHHRGTPPDFKRRFRDPMKKRDKKDKNR